MGSIRMVLLDGLTVADLLALRQGGFFEGAEVRLASGDTASPNRAPLVIPVQEVVQPVAVPVVPAAAAEEPSLTPEQQAALVDVRRELAEYRVERGLPPAAEAPSEPRSGISPTADPVIAPEPAALVTAGLPSVVRLAACTKLRDVLQLLIEGGMPSSELAGYLESVKAEVPLLQRISNISDRVARTLEVMGTGG